MEYACGLGSWNACVWFSSSLFKSGVDSNRQKALELAKKTCIHGEAEGCVNVGSMLAWWYGRGKPKDVDLAAAMDWAKRGCDLGSVGGCNAYALGLIQRDQASDRAAARALLESQCAKGFEPSCVTLGHEQSVGTFGPPDPDRASSLWRRSCACGDTDGCINTASILFDRKEKKAAFALVRYACANGNYQACAGLAKTYLEGTVVSRDTAQARKYFEQACRLDDGESCAALKTVEGQ
jgi:TPR repeat protein